jgi:hypothetical protein
MVRQSLLVNIRIKISFWNELVLRADLGAILISEEVLINKG